MGRSKGPWWLRLMLLGGVLGLVSAAFALWPDSQHSSRLVFMAGGFVVLAGALKWLKHRAEARQWAPWPTRGPLAAARRLPGAGAVAAIHRHGGMVVPAFFMVAWLIWMVALTPSAVMKLLDGDLSGLLPVAVTTLLVLVLIAAVAAERRLDLSELIASLDEARRRREQEVRRGERAVPFSSEVRLPRLGRRARAAEAPRAADGETGRSQATARKALGG